MSSSNSHAEAKEGHPVKDSIQLQEETTSKNNGQHSGIKKGARFWLILLSLSICAAVTALDGTIITTTLPSITAALGGGEEYVWVSGSYFLAT
jgi:hypothetical protein